MYVPFKNEVDNVHYEEEVNEEDQHSVNSVRHYYLFDYKIIIKL